VIFEDVWNSDPALVLAANPWSIAAEYAPTLTRTSPLIRMNVGDQDAVLPANVDFHNRLTSLGITHSFNTAPGIGHAAIPLLTAIGPTNWAFYQNALLPRCDASDIAGPNQSPVSDGSYTADDIIVFLGWYFAADPRADIAGANQAVAPDTQLTADDIIVFLGRYFAGC
jgi:hypothetical protein